MDAITSTNYNIMDYREGIIATSRDPLGLAWTDLLIWRRFEDVMATSPPPGLPSCGHSQPHRRDARRPEPDLPRPGRDRRDGGRRARADPGTAPLWGRFRRMVTHATV